MKNKEKKMKNKVFAALIITMLVLCLTSCDNSAESGTGSERGNSQERLVFDDADRPLGERELATVIPDDVFTFLINGETTTMAITEVTIERRQTNNKEDVVYAVIEMENDYTHRTEYYRLTINFYDIGGWQIDDFESYQSFVAIPINPPSDNFAQSDTVSQYVNQGYEVSFLSSNTANWESGESSFVFEVSREERFYSHGGTVTANIRFNESQNSWRVDNITPNIHSTLKSATLNGVVSTDILGEWEANWTQRSLMNAEIRYSFQMRITNVTETHIYVSGRVANVQWVEGNMYDIGFDTIFEYRIEVEDNNYILRGEIDYDESPGRQCRITVRDGNITIIHGHRGEPASSIWTSGEVTLTRVSQ